MSELYEKVVPKSIVENDLYWPPFFLSVLECIVYHKNLSGGFHGIRRLSSSNIKSLALLKGNNPDGFFRSLKGYLYNWGLQYLLVNYFNLDVGNYLVNPLIDKIASGLGVNFGILSGRDVQFFMHGKDSLNHESDVFIKLASLSNSFVVSNEGFLPYADHVKKDLKFCDICMVLFSKENDRKPSSLRGDCNDYKNFLFFGEVEGGGRGSKEMEKKDYWQKKSKHCSFGVSVVDNIDGSIYLGKKFFCLMMDLKGLYLF